MSHTSPKASHFLASEYPNAPADRAAFHVIPAPMEESVSYGGGTARGPLAILRASQQLEADDRGVAPGKAGIHTQPSLRRPPHDGGAAAWPDAIQTRVTRALAAGAKPLILGGEHTVTLGAARALAAARIQAGFIHIDAHADLRDSYEGTPLSHACVMRRVAELGFPIVQFGTRAYSREEAEYRDRHNIRAFDSADLQGSLPARPLPPGFPKHLYITFDLDGLDPSQMPATGTPVAGGLFWHQTMLLLDRVIRGRTVIGADVVELAPISGLHFADFAAAQVAHRLLALMMP